MMICYAAVPARIAGLRTARPARTAQSGRAAKPAAAAVTGLFGAIVRTLYAITRVGIYLLGSSGPWLADVGSAEVSLDPGPDRVLSYLVMGVFDQPVKRLQSYDPFPPVWRMRCLCSFRAGKAGEIAACGCRFWWRVGRRGRWYAISRRRALGVFARELRRELDYFDVTGNWPAG